MAGDGTPSPESTGDQDPGVTPDSGAPQGGSGQANADADAFASERERYEARVRDLQSKSDRLAAELAKLKEAKESVPGSSEAEPLTADGIMALLRKEREISELRPALREEFKLADPALFTREYDSPEAMRAAVEESHNRISSLVKDGVDSESKALLERYIAKYGDLPPDVPNQSGSTPAGLPTAAELQTYSVAQLNEFVEQHGEDTLNRIIKGR